MNYFLTQIILAASDSDGEDTFWMQILVLVILAALVGVGSLIKTSVNKSQQQDEYYPEGVRNWSNLLRHQVGRLKELKNRWSATLLKTPRPETATKKSLFDFDSAEEISRERPIVEPRKEKNLAGGMEMLKLDFLVKTVEKTEGDDNDDVTMRKLSFNELLRREQLKQADSKALKVYATNKGNLYGKEIQCKAMKELAERTKSKIGA